ncbi:hypothetical protein KRX57_01350 [Weeksellaceae bacterium TAE3-ERU29]|nr:hypothetical protein [Weeksellaceae bacterium TAE3-ERU29]
MENTSKIILGLIGVAIVAGAVYYYYKNSQEEIKKEEVDKLTLRYIKDYFQRQEKPTTNLKAIVLKVDNTNGEAFRLYNDFPYYVLTYYNEQTREILTDNTLIVKANTLETNLLDAFGDKDMLILE